MTAPTKQPVNALDRCSQHPATESLVQPKEASAPQAQTLSAEVPIGVLEVPVTVWGSRRMTSDPGRPDRIDVVAEETCTVIVFPHGAVIRLSATVEPGQLMMVANRKSHQNVLCRVVNVRKYSNAKGYAEIEFLQPAEGFWEAYILQGTLMLTERAKIVAPASEASAKASPVAPKQTITQTWVPPQPAASSEQAKAASTPAEDFWSSSFPKEVISVLADAATASPAPGATIRDNLESMECRKVEVPAVGKPVQSAAMGSTAAESPFGTTVPKVSEPNPLPSSAIANSAEFGVLSTEEHQRDESASERSARSSVRELFRRLVVQGEARITTEKVHLPRRSLILTGASLVSLFTIGAIGIILLHQRATQSATAQTSPAPVASTVSALADNVQSLQPENNITTNVTGPRIPVKATGFPGSRSKEFADNVRIYQPPTEKPTPVGKIPNVRLLAPRSMERRSAAAVGRDVPPDVTKVDPNVSASAFQGIFAGLSPAGGRMREPRLVSRAVPSYPAAARQIGIEGDVTIDAVIDIDGKLANPKVVSGAPLLQQAALDSLLNWKYEPGYLDDKPVAVKTSIIVKFRLR
jgi:TonB family protein